MVALGSLEQKSGLTAALFFSILDFGGLEWSGLLRHQRNGGDAYFPPISGCAVGIDDFMFEVRFYGTPR